MGLRLTDAVGQGQAHQLDHQSELSQEQARYSVRLEVRESERTSRVVEENRSRTGLTAEEAAQTRGDAWRGGKLVVFENWKTGRNRRDKSNDGAVIIDGGGVPPDPNPPGPLVRPPSMASDNDTPAWRAWKTAHKDAASNEENAEQEFGPFLSTPRQARRRYTLIETF
jgi:hypothetical protein